MKCKQVRLKSGTTKTVTLIDVSKKTPKQGDRIIFKGEERVWEIEKITGPTLDRKDVNREWHVGGL